MLGFCQPQQNFQVSVFSVMFVLLCKPFCVYKVKSGVTSCCRLCFLAFAFVFSRAYAQILKKLIFNCKCLKVVGQRSSAICPFGKHILPLVFRVMAMRGCAKTANPAQFLFTRSWQSYWGHETVKSLFKIYDCHSDAQYSGRSGK